MINYIIILLYNIEIKNAKTEKYILLLTGNLWMSCGSVRRRRTH